MKNKMRREEAERLTTEFFKRRFPDRNIEDEKRSGYFYEWLSRFESGNPGTWADYESLKIIQVLKKET